jgi:anti-anti-sigma factor
MKTTRHGNAVVLSLVTEDFADPPQVEAAFEEVVKLLRSRTVVVDMKSVSRLTSIGLSTISAGADVARAHRARFALAGLRPEVRRFLEKVGFPGEQKAGEGEFEIADDVESALQAIGQKEDAESDETG